MAIRKPLPGRVTPRAGGFIPPGQARRLANKYYASPPGRESGDFPLRRVVSACLKFLRRHVGKMIALVVVLLLAGGGVGAYGWYLHEIEDARRALAAERYDDAHDRIESALR